MEKTSNQCSILAFSKSMPIADTENQDKSKGLKIKINQRVWKQSLSQKSEQKITPITCTGEENCTRGYDDIANGIWPFF